ncbi:MAG: hypothetical protein K2J12_07495 [Muribaculaceae bacterium]|nr:hypothetical protein [Muribaculaceae bacterium]
MIANFYDTQKQIRLYGASCEFVNNVIKKQPQHAIQFALTYQNVIKDAIDLLYTLGYIKPDLYVKMFPIQVFKFDNQHLFAHLGDFKMLDFDRFGYLDSVLRSLVLHFELITL